MQNKDWPTGMMVIQGNQLGTLRDVMTGWIKNHPLKPLEQEHILVQSNGIAQWLKMALAKDEDEGGLGIAAAVQVQLPMRFLWQGYRSFNAAIPSISPFDKAPLTWCIFRLLSDVEAFKQAVDEPAVFEPLLAFLGADDDPRRVYQLAAKLADLYDQYQVYRPDWLAQWQAGHNHIIKQGSKQKYASIPAKYLWQPALWRVIAQDIEACNQASPQIDIRSRADIHNDIIELCHTTSHAPAQLPRRVIVFGISALPHTMVEFLHAISRFTQVMLFVHNPCQHYWGDLIEGNQLLKQYNRATNHKLPQGVSHQELHLLGNPLLAAWGKQGRDYLHLLDQHDQAEQYRERFATASGSSIDIFHSPLEELSTDRTAGYSHGQKKLFVLLV